MGHIELSRSADLVLVAPATADLMAKAANGLADDLASTVLLAADKPIVMAPAMNVRMWLHPATRRNRAALEAAGVTLVGPDEGEMACGEFGPGRMAEPEVIFEAVLAELRRGRSRPLAGKHVLVTAGPTAEPIDPVRVLTNRSSGKQGYAIGARPGRPGRSRDARLRARRPWPPRAASTRIDVETRRADAGRLPARPAGRRRGLRGRRRRLAPRDGVARQAQEEPRGPPTLRLVENPDILASLSARGPRRPGWWSASPRRPTTWRPTRRPSSAARAATGSWPTTSATRRSWEATRTRFCSSTARAWSAGRAPQGEVARRLADRIAEALSLSPRRDDPVGRRLPHGEGLPLPAYEKPRRRHGPARRRGGGRTADAGARRAGRRPDRPRHRLAAWFRGSGAAEVGHGAGQRRHLPQYARHDRQRLPRRGEGDPDQPRRGAGCRSAAATASPSWWSRRWSRRAGRKSRAWTRPRGAKGDSARLGPEEAQPSRPSTCAIP